MTVERIITNLTPLGDVRQWLLDSRGKGVDCPCCGQFVKLYRRSLPSAAAVVMIRLWHLNEGRNWVFLPDVLDTLGLSRTAQQGGYGTFAHHWGLMERRPGERDDGSNRTGFWRLTDDGREFVTRRMDMYKYAYVFNNHCYGFDGPAWMITDALGKKFSYQQLMSA